MIRLIAAAAVCALFPTAGLAQTNSDETTQTGAADQAGARLPGLRAVDDYGVWLELEVAPEFVSHSPFRSSSRSTDATSISWTLGYATRIGRRLALEAGVGPRVTSDTDRDSSSESSLAAIVELRGQNEVGFVPFVNASVERGYERFFDGGTGTALTVAAGVRYALETGPWTIGAQLFPSVVESSVQFGDFYALTVAGEVDVALIDTVLGLHVDGQFEARRYRETNPEIGDERRDNRFNAFAGFDFAPAINTALAGGGRDPGSIFRTAAVGLRWTEIESNSPDEEESSLTIVPSITLRVGFPSRQR